MCGLLTLPVRNPRDPRRLVKSDPENAKPIRTKMKSSLKTCPTKTLLTKKQLCSQKALNLPDFYTLTKIHKPTPVGRSIVSGSGGPTERISRFVDSLLKPIAKKQESAYIYS